MAIEYAKREAEFTGIPFEEVWQSDPVQRYARRLMEK